MTYQAGLQYPSSYSEQDGTNLYVRNLPLEMTSDLLLATFTPYGKVLEHRIMRDFATGISLGFGFVRFEKKSEADAAIATLNGHTLGTIPLVVKVADKVKEIGQVSDNVYIKQMPLNWDENNVRQLFGNYGNIQQSIVLRDINTGTSRGIAFVRYSTEAEASAAIAALNGFTPPGSMQGLVVRFAETEEQKQARLRRTGLLPTAPVIPNYGGLATPSPATPVSPAAQYSYAHAQYQQQCMQLNAYSNYGAALSAAAGSYTNRYTPYSSQSQEPDPSNLFIFHLPMEVNDAALYQLFSPFGTLESVKVTTDANGMSKGYGFVKFFCPQEAYTAIQMMNGYKIGNKYLKVSVKTKPRR